MRTLTLGLALGAGGTRGAAHVGVMQVLEDAGIRPAVIAGTSIGSLYGGAYAVGRSPDEMADGIRNCPHTDVVNFFRHRLKIRHNNRLARRFYSALAGYQIEHLDVKYAAVASDMEQRCPVAIDRGPIIDAIEASIAIPLIARPVIYQGKYLLDGGFWDSAPVDAATALGADVVVAVELGKPVTIPVRWHTSAAWLAARMERVPMRRTIAGLPFTIRAVSTPLKPGRTAQVVLRPRLPRAMGGTSPFMMSRCLDAGIAAAEQALPAIKALLAGEPAPDVAEEFAPAPRFRLEPGSA